MPIVPDEKDWTWVLERVCPACGFDPAGVDLDDLAGRIDATSRAWAAILQRPDVRERPGDATWPPLEYACHVRDVHQVYAGRVGRMLANEDPHYQNWNQDATAIDKRHPEQDPAVVAQALTASGAALGAIFAGVSGYQWERTGQRSDGATLDVARAVRYLVGEDSAYCTGTELVVDGASPRGRTCHRVDQDLVAARDPARSRRRSPAAGGALQARWA